MNYKKKLQEIEKSNGLRGYVANKWLNNIYDYNGTSNEQIKAWLADFQQGGCASGLVNNLVYYSDTEVFFDKYYSEIMELRQDYKDQTGKTLDADDFNLKSWFAWWAFEYTIDRIAEELGIE